MTLFYDLLSFSCTLVYFNIYLFHIIKLFFEIVVFVYLTLYLQN